MSDDPAITRLPPFRCPYCGDTMDAVGTTDGDAGAPTVGDHCGCMHCGIAMVFVDALGTGALSLRPMTAKEFEALSDDQKTELARVQWFARHIYQPQRASRN